MLSDLSAPEFFLQTQTQRTLSPFRFIRVEFRDAGELPCFLQIDAEQKTFFENFTGNPAASIPAGLTKEGLPVGMQIIGRKYMDEDVLAAAYAYEQIRPWSYEIPLNRTIGEQ